MDNTDKYINLISIVLKNDASAEEKQELYSWLKESKENRKTFDEYKDLWDAVHLASYEKTYNPQKGWERFNVLANAAENQQKSGVSRKLFVTIAKYAAIIIATLSAGYIINRNIGAFHQDKDEFYTIHVPNGKKITSLLSDGTKVILNSGSTLKYKKDYNSQKREVYLEGEAYFEVFRNKEKSFIVNASNVNVSVLGTKFNVKAYPDEESVETVLVEGKVRINIDDISDKYILKPDEVINYHKLTRKIEKKTDVNAADYIKWSEGVLMFKNETLLDITNKLERWYNVQFEFKDSSIMDYHFTGTFKTDSIKDILVTICNLSDITYEVKDETFILIK